MLEPGEPKPFEHRPGAETGGEADSTSATSPAPPEVSQPMRRTTPQSSGLFIFPILLGAFICGINIWVAVRWGGFRWSPVFSTLIATSLFIGLFLIVYAIVLWRFGPGQAPSYAKWVIVPLLVAVLASAATVWATEIIAQRAPLKPCVELYQEAQNIYKGNQSFRMPSWETDESRCDINKTLGFSQ